MTEYSIRHYKRSPFERLCGAKRHRLVFHFEGEYILSIEGDSAHYAWQAGVIEASRFLGVMICEPNPFPKDDPRNALQKTEAWLAKIFLGEK